MKNDNIKWCYHFPWYIFCVIIYVIIFRVLSFMLSFDVIIFHSQQMLSFLCYHFPLYSTYFVLSFTLFFLFPENVTHSCFCHSLMITGGVYCSMIKVDLLSAGVLKGFWHEIFDFKFFSKISFPQAPEYHIRTISNFFKNSRRYSQMNVFRQCHWRRKKFRDKIFLKILLRA